MCFNLNSGTPAPPSGPNGNPVSYDTWINSQRLDDNQDARDHYNAYLKSFPNSSAAPAPDVADPNRIPLAPAPSAPGTFSAHTVTNRIGPNDLRVALPSSTPPLPRILTLPPRGFSPLIPVTR